VLRTLLGRLVEDVIDHSSHTIKAARRRPVTTCAALPAMITFSPEMAGRAKELLTFLYSRFYHHPSLTAVRRRSVDCLVQLFELLVSHPHLLSRNSPCGSRMTASTARRAITSLPDRPAGLSPAPEIDRRTASLEAVHLEQSALL